jgi:hypothetical protein
MENMEVQGYLYHCTIYREVLVNKAQEFKRRHNKEDYESEFYDEDDPDALRWIKDVTMSFAEKELDKLQQRIQFEYNNGRGKRQLIESMMYIYFIDTNCLIGEEPLLHRDRIYIRHEAEVNITEKGLKEMLDIK